MEGQTHVGGQADGWVSLQMTNVPREGGGQNPPPSKLVTYAGLLPTAQLAGLHDPWICLQKPPLLTLK